ncbi:homeobox domain-containing protein [Phanerochaete sordida]|uniref:Homeobox domain-containing protein n=1 Tax=Phanerochaete sordida TaxID=48140 RepID=A0A9P3G0W7_9APHY|nr:homeobox domain-containing protein [Phanerochaete sordida]
MLSELPEHVPTQSGQGTSSSTQSALSYESESTADPECPSPQLSLSSPASPANLSDSAGMGAAQEPSSGPLRSRSGSRSHDAAGDAKSKRKRSRVTPEQLAHLERFFAADRSPTAARRKEISDMLGMTERQTQIWFQNRRAKAKLLDGKLDQESMELPPDVPPELAAGWDTDLQLLIHEDDEPITIIPCQELTVGSWRRLASTHTKYDLVAYICHNRKTLAWFIHASNCGFKMEIAFDSVIDTKFTNNSPGMGQASFILSRPPTFFMEHAGREPGPGGIPIRVWRPSADWTEKKQASKVLRHDLVGAAIQLAHVLRTIASAKAGPSVPLYPITYDGGHPASRHGAALSPSLVGGMIDEIAGPSQRQQSSARRFSRASVHYHTDAALERAGAGGHTSPGLGAYTPLARGAGSPALPHAYPLPGGDFAVPSGVSALYDHSPTPPPHPSSPEHFLTMQVPIALTRRSFSGTPSVLGGGGGVGAGPQAPPDYLAGGEDLRLPPSIAHSGRRHSSFADGPVGTLTQAMSSLGSHASPAWEPHIGLPPAPPYLLPRDYRGNSTSSSPHLNFATPQEYPPEFQQSFPQG